MEEDFRQIRKHKPDVELERLLQHLKNNAKGGKNGKYTFHAGKTPCFEWIDNAVHCSCKWTNDD
jgi:hypothetical protein